MRFTKGHSTSNRRRFDVDIRRYVEDQIWTNFHVVSTYFLWCNFDGLEICSVSTYFFDVISMVEKSTLFPRTFFDVISMVEKCTLTPRTFFDVISLVKISTVFLLTFFDVNLMVEKSAVFARTFFYKNFDEFHVVFGVL